MTRVGNALDDCGQLGRPVGRGGDQSAEEVDQGPAERVHLRMLGRILGGLLLGHLEARDQVRLGPDPVDDPDALQALDHETQGTVGRPRELMDHAHRPDAIEIVGTGLVHLGIALGHQGQEPVAPHDVVDELERPRLADRERDGGQGEHHLVPERQDGERVGDRQVVGIAGPFHHQSASVRFGSEMRSNPRS